MKSTRSSRGEGHSRAPLLFTFAARRSKVAPSSCSCSCRAIAGAYANPLTETPERKGDLRTRVAPVGQSDWAGMNAFGVYAALFALGFFGSIFWVEHKLEELFNPWPWMVLLLAASSFLFWLMAYRRNRVIEDVPTSTIAAAAQGYVELRGIAAPSAGNTLTGRLTHIPCIWYRFVVTDATDSSEKRVADFGTRSVPFVLRDKTGECLVDPGQAEVVCNRCQSWVKEDIEYQEWSIRVGDPVHAVGYLSSGGDRKSVV